MLSKILVPLDGSELSERILSFVGRLPQRQTLELILLRVLRQVDPRELGACKDEFQDALAHLFGLEAKLRSEGTRSVSMITQGAYAAEQILKMVGLLQPSLLAISTHGRGGKLTELRGGVAERLLRRCPVPLLLGNPSSLPLDPGAGFAKIVVPLDGSQMSAAILDLVEGIARHHESEVILFTADPTGKLGNDVQSTLAPYKERLERNGVKRVHVASAVGDEATRIIDFVSTEGADLLAMTSHSRPDPKGRFFGSIAETVVASCACPLLLQRIPAPPGQGGGPAQG